MDENSFLNLTTNKTMKEHNLKLDIKYFDDAICGKKTFEVRFDDRQFMAVAIATIQDLDNNGIFKSN